MTISSNLSKFNGKKIALYDPEKGIKDLSLVYKIGIDWDQHDEGIRIEQMLEKFANDPKASEVKELVIGCWSFESEGNDQLIEMFVNVKDKLSSLQYLFLGDITYEETEMSWIENGCVTPILNAYPKMVHFQVRGGNNLSFDGLKHANLQALIVETGGMSKSIIDELYSADIPNLEHLELWLGDENYGCDIMPEDLKPLLDGKYFPRLKYLGLCNYYMQDDMAKAVAEAPIVDRIETLDLSKGNLSDEGGEALLKSSRIAKLKNLDLSHHYLSDQVMGKFSMLGVKTNIDEQLAADEDDDEVYRYIMVSE